MFAAIARSYDLNNRLHSFGRDQHWRKTAVRLCDVRPTDRVLDVACGTGDLAQAFADAGPASVIGLDFTAEMLEIARHKTQARRQTPQYIQGDALNLPFDDGSFDIVSIAFGIRNVTDPMKALREFRRVLAPGGRLVILEFSEPRNALLRLFNAIYCRHIMPWTATLIARDRSGAYRYLPRSIATFVDSNEMVAMMQHAGFGGIHTHPLTFGVCTAYIGRVQSR